MDETSRVHPVDRAWDRVMAQLGAAMASRHAAPAHTVVLVPYAGLIGPARSAWQRAQTTATPSHSLPRFETTMSWARSLGGVEAGADDLRLDAARDALTAASLLARAGLAAQQELLAPGLMQAAWSLARVAAAVPPAERVQWGVRLGAQLTSGMESAMFAHEAATARVALAWAANSSYPTDPVFSATPELLVWLDGFQTEAMLPFLQQSLGQRVLVLPLAPSPDAPRDPARGAVVTLHAAQDAEDEAQRAAACVLAHLAAGHSPVGLVAQDRLLTRRVHAMLNCRGVALRDESGWKLSTTRAAATLMSLLRAMAWNAGADAVLDWLKNAPAFDPVAVTQTEIDWRRAGVRDWRSVSLTNALAQQVQGLRDSLQAGRTLRRWLTDLRAALCSAGHWPLLLNDAAGQAVLATLRLHEGAEMEFAETGPRLGQSQFTAWIGRTLEAANFLPDPVADAASEQVMVLPPSQLLGRSFPALVFAGCDERRQPLVGELAGPWSPAQRALLGLPSREQLAQATRASWRYALAFPDVDVLWRGSEDGESLMPSGLVQELQLQRSAALASDPSTLRLVNRQPGGRPGPLGAALPLRQLSSSAYADLRACPYRFFALRQLGLKEAEEIEIDLSKRDFGNWVHHVLKLFHEDLRHAPASGPTQRLALIDAAAEQATRQLGLSPGEFLPFAAAWPRVRAGYLEWLAAHEASGATFVAAEVWRETPLGPLTLAGKIDRIDRLPDGSTLVLDYKTEARGKTAQRIKEPLEDTQLAFYAALLSDDTLAAAYLNLAEKEGSRSYVQADIVALRDRLLEGIASDMTRIAQGAPMPALGEGQACEHCAARGLCRKDFWDV